MDQHQLVKIKNISALDTWPLRHEVMWPEMPLDYSKLPDDELGYHFGLFLNTKLVSVVSLFIADDHTAQFRKFATKEEEQGKGYGSKLLTHLLEFALKENIFTLWCNARLDKTDYYEKFGFIKTEKSFTKQNLKFVILQKRL